MRFFEILDNGGSVGRIALEDDGTGYVVLASHPGRVFDVAEKDKAKEWTQSNPSEGWLLKGGEQ